MIKQVYLLILFTCSVAQTDTLSKSLYFGWGLGPNIGGVVGIGFEKEIVKGFSLSVALGSIHPMIDEETTFSKFSYDFGVKYYAYKGLFLGANYGYVDYNINELFANGEKLSGVEEKLYGFTLSIGYKMSLSTKINLSIYLAKWLDEEEKSTGSKMTNDITKDLTPDLPLFGLMLGCNL